MIPLITHNIKGQRGNSIKFNRIIWNKEIFSERKDLEDIAIIYSMKNKTLENL